MATLTIRTQTQSWRLLYWRAGFFSLIGFLLVFSGTTISEVAVILLSFLLLVSGLTAIRFALVSRAIQATVIWFVLAGILDVVFGMILLLYSNNPTQGIILTFGVWGILVGFIQAIESLYGFLAIQASGPNKGGGFSFLIIHFINVLIGGGMAFTLLQQPAGADSIQVAGLFPIAFSIGLAILTRRFQVTEPMH